MTIPKLIKKQMNNPSKLPITLNDIPLKDQGIIKSAMNIKPKEYIAPQIINLLYKDSQDINSKLMREVEDRRRLQKGNIKRITQDNDTNDDNNHKHEIKTYKAGLWNSRQEQTGGDDGDQLDDHFLGNGGREGGTDKTKRNKNTKGTKPGISRERRKTITLDAIRARIQKKI